MSGERKKRLPPWLSKRLPGPEELDGVRNALERLNLATVCREAHCPNMCECFARGTATFMILGRNCTRNCSFCAVGRGEPDPVDPDEPARVARAAVELGLKHVVITSVTRDDLADGGSTQFAGSIRAVRDLCGATVEVLTPDFRGSEPDIDRVILARPDVFNHNLETVSRLQPVIRPQASYGRSLAVLEYVGSRYPGIAVKSGLMLGMGETEEELYKAMRDLVNAGCRILTLGQYLQPSRHHPPVKRYPEPGEFDAYAEKAREFGFIAVMSGPMVRSSYKADELLQAVRDAKAETVSG